MENTFSARLKWALENASMKPVDLSNATGIGKSSISRYLKGEYVPKQRKLTRIASALNVSEGWLLTGAEQHRIEPHNVPYVKFTTVTDNSAKKQAKVDVKDIINNATFLFDGNDYSLSQSDKDMLTNIIKSVLNGKESK